MFENFLGDAQNFLTGGGSSVNAPSDQALAVQQALVAPTLEPLRRPTQPSPFDNLVKMSNNLGSGPAISGAPIGSSYYNPAGQLCTYCLKSF